MIQVATLLLLKYKLPYILHDPRSYLTPIKIQKPYILHEPRNGATLILLKYKLPYILHDPRANLLLLKYKNLISDMNHEMELP
jgi:hypothetical protein